MPICLVIKGMSMRWTLPAGSAFFISRAHNVTHRYTDEWNLFQQYVVS